MTIRLAHPYHQANLPTTHIGCAKGINNLPCALTRITS
jgi:hypothetical protein